MLALDEYARRFPNSSLLGPLQAILDGERARTLTNSPDLHFKFAAEIHVLLDHLGTLR